MWLNKEAIAAMFTDAVIIGLVVLVSEQALSPDNAAAPLSTSYSRVVDSLADGFHSVIGSSSVDGGENTLFSPLVRNICSMFPPFNGSDSTIVPHFLGSSFFLVSVVILFSCCLVVRLLVDGFYRRSSVYSESKTLVPKVEPRINNLPQDLITGIINRLNPKDLGIVSCVSTEWYKKASDHDGGRWGLPIPRPSSLSSADERTWKEFFDERKFTSKIFLGKYRVNNLAGHTEEVLTVFLLASAKLIFTAGCDSVVRVWDMNDGSSVASSRPLGHRTIRAIAADTKLLLAGGAKGIIHCWKAVEGVSHLFDIQGFQNYELLPQEHNKEVTSLALDFARIYSGSRDTTVRVWDRTSLLRLLVLKHEDSIWGVAPHSQSIASMSFSKVYIWQNPINRKNPKPAATILDCHEGNTSALARSHTGEFLFTGGEDGAIHMFDISTFSEEDGIFKVATWITHSGPVNSLAYEFPWLVSASKDGMVSLIDVRKFFKIKSCRSVIKRESTIESPQIMLHGSGSSLSSVCIGGNRIVCGGEDGVVKVLDFSQTVEKLMKLRQCSLLTKIIEYLLG